MDYKANSDRIRDEKKEPVPEKKVEKVISGTAKTKKKNAFLDVFIAEDIHDVKTFVISDVIIPTVKKLIYDTITNAAGMMLGENIKKSSIVKSSFRNYNEISSERKREYTRSDLRTRNRYDEQIVDSKGEAEDVLEEMDKILRAYGLITVATFYELLGKDSDHTDCKYGWTNLRDASSVRLRTGEYLIKLPKPMPLD